MKYGQHFQENASAKWAPYNVDYNELKNLIKVHTTKKQNSAIVIPGQTNTALSEFEELFYNELYNQHDRVDLFVKDKAGGISRRLRHLQTVVLKLLARLPYTNGRPMSQRKREKFQRYDAQIESCGEDIKQLQRFVDAQRVAFHKILKKYKKWTGSSTLGDRFNQQVLGSPKSFTRRDFTPMLSQYKNLINDLRDHTPDTSLPPTPQRSRRPSAQVQVRQPQQQYWNEYDNGSEGEQDAPYTILMDTNSTSAFPGAEAIANIFSSVKIPVEQVKAWLGPKDVPQERQSLLRNASGRSTPLGLGYSSAPSESDLGEAGYASSSDIPGYSTHYATFPSVRDQKFTRDRERLQFYGTLGSFIASTGLLLVAGILITTGKHKLRVKVDAGAITGVVSSLAFAALGAALMFTGSARVGWLQKLCFSLMFVAICTLNGFLLVLIADNVGFANP